MTLSYKLRYLEKSRRFWVKFTWMQSALILAHFTCFVVFLLDESASFSNGQVLRRENFPFCEDQGTTDSFFNLNTYTCVMNNKWYFPWLFKRKQEESLTVDAHYQLGDCLRICRSCPSQFHCLHIVQVTEENWEVLQLVPEPYSIRSFTVLLWNYYLFTIIRNWQGLAKTRQFS